MSWVKIDDGFDEHPKLVGLSPLAVTLHIRALCWCSRQQTDGHVPQQAISRLAAGLCDPAGDNRQSPRDPASIVDELTAAGLWERTNETNDSLNGRSVSFTIHDYLKYNPSRTETERKRSSFVEQRRQAGVKSGLARRTKSFGSRSAPVERNVNPLPLPQPLLKTPPLTPQVGGAPLPVQVPKQPRKATPKEECPECQHVLKEFNRARNGVKPFTGAGKGLQFIHARHREHGVKACVEVAERKIRDCLRKRETVKYATPETIFREANFERALNDVPSWEKPKRTLVDELIEEGVMKVDANRDGS